MVRRTSTHQRRYRRPHLCVTSPERPCCWSCSSCDGSRTEELVPWCWTSSVHSISCLEVRTHASTRADRIASEAEARGSLGADLWITRSMKVGRRGDVDKPGARRDGHRSSLKRLRHYICRTHTMAAEPKSSPAGGLCEHSGAAKALHRKGCLFGRFVMVFIVSRVQLANCKICDITCE